jgi:uncharacterized protein
MQGRLRIWMERVGVFGPAVLLTVIAFAIAYYFVQPAPPRHIVMATGSPNGVYYYYGQIYRDLMAKEGVEVTLRETAGSIENIELLKSGKADVAFVQGGTRPDGPHPTLRSLASLYFEPVWVFVRRDLKAARLADLRGRRVSIGAEGGGARPIALQLLEDLGLDATNVQMSDLGGADAVKALREHALDAGFFIGPANAPVLKELFATPELRLLPINEAAAYRLRHRFLSLLTLPEGAIDLAKRVPEADTVVLAPAANLVVGEDFHPALAELLLVEAHRIHRYSGIFEETNQFPSRQHLEYPIADAAERYFDSGPSLLRRYLPFWAANLVDRLKIMLLPLIALAYPLFKVIPPTYDWRMRSRIDRWYKALQEIERDIEAATTADDLRTQLTQLEALDHSVRHLTMPVAYGNPLYTLRHHITMLRHELASAVERGA